ncbi:serine/threonine protein kinase [Sporosarcina sp. P12(2017)]|uniref:serine/threonine protein kinase n=1 Tax=unclassified Sporosarcina TaxID=2647733 RepID=UPI000C1636E2|nr:MULTISPECIES: serine/threonine protein kinase [unclassified Sporosarcina]PIC57026.1 serine/threonine protein kinase [Sporosarcina sp. P10]PIC60409.1 serine/threonine protein kinase [Sporosarcina sp. P12(2017)]
MSDYEKNYNETKMKQLDLWGKMVTELLGSKSEDTVEITDKSQIIKDLNFIGKNKALNHAFMPSGGGLDLTGAVASNEKGLVELNFGGSALIVNPDSFTFHPVGDNPEWWYFRLNTSPFAPSGVYEVEEDDETEKTYKSALNREVAEDMKYYGEELLEIAPGDYIDRSFWDINHLGYNEYGEEIPLPKNARVVSRKYNGGAFVIFPKFSAYNHNPATYDARHNRVSDEKFGIYIKGIVNELAKRS